MFDELVGRYGADAIVTAQPHILDSGESYRWEVQIDGMDVPDVYVQARGHPEHRDVMVLLLVHGDDEAQIAIWATHSDKYGPAAVTRRLGDLR